MEESYQAQNGEVSGHANGAAERPRGLQPKVYLLAMLAAAPEASMASWIFQGNPEAFDLDGYLAADFETITWVVRRYKDKIALGDTVYIWRSAGKTKEPAGVIAECRVASSVAPMPEDTPALSFWNEKVPTIEDRVSLLVLRVATSKQMLKRDWIKEDPVLRDCAVIKQPQGTNFELTPEHAARLRMLWDRTGEDWTWREVAAALWAYDKTKGGVVSMKPGSPVANVALAIGRAVGGVYNKLMNIRAIDPTDERIGLEAGSGIDEDVWERFFDPLKAEIDRPKLMMELERLDLHLEEDAPSEPRVKIEVELREPPGSLAGLLKKYEVALATGIFNELPAVTEAPTQSFIRNPLVVEIAKLRADRKCEIPGCSTSSFKNEKGQDFCEIHHVVPLAEGGKDVVENAICLCPVHHREAHHGKRRAELREVMQRVRMGTLEDGAPAQAHIKSDA
ncbi:EVE domain-containing protein [Variovorax sp. J22R115]|uniref:EVE domain-containing protein n=1 Tax=Variovorax sp. J22R115 TaxID=3053509 RepID=UPI002576B705|nr:EVE domain-containing protein [Variovorax sp. J22R115]MDM0052011.1 EVE domain-containing protein [Variovorax sp. J22R115]